LALGFELVTPPFLLPQDTAVRLNDTFLDLAFSLGYALPNPQLALPGNLETITRHANPAHRYDSNHASFGAAFVLVILPSMLAVLFARRQLGARWLFAVASLIVWLAFILTGLYLLVAFGSAIYALRLMNFSMDNLMSDMLGGG